MNILANPRSATVALLVICGAQMMIVLDNTIMNVALPSIQAELKLSSTSLSWVINAYTLVFGGLLLLGGRIGDILGRRKVFIAGNILFAVASVFGGMAQSDVQLLIARGLQGVGGALASPTALALITTSFAEGPERTRAFGIFSAVSGTAAALGLLLGGILTDLLNWRWVLFVNAPIALIVVVAAPIYLLESERIKVRLDIAGAITATTGVISLVYATIQAAENGWGQITTMMWFGAALLMLTLFVIIERNATMPLMPLHLFSNRNRVGAYVTGLMWSAAFFSSLFFVTLFLQQILRFSPLQAGFASVPVALILGVSAQISARLVSRHTPRVLIATGLTIASVGFVWLWQITSPSATYVDMLLPLLLMASGIGMVFVPTNITGMSHIAAHESGVASGMLNTTQQVGGSIGLAILVTVASSSARDYITELSNTAVARGEAELGAVPDGALITAGTVYGWSMAFFVAAMFCLVGAVITYLLIRPTAPDVHKASVHVRM
ncbi:MAG: MFS transporter [Roseiflexaceae bacterium]|jgi:EmrB/QacA subfamily drug resistance transporter|nr:MFS transporter [Chloroflexaceae bacterium]